MTLTMRTFDGNELGTLKLEGSLLVGDTPPTRQLARKRMRQFTTAQKAYDSLRGYNNGYITISEDTISGQVRMAAGGSGSK